MEDVNECLQPPYDTNLKKCLTVDTANGYAFIPEPVDMMINEFVTDLDLEGGSTDPEGTGFGWFELFNKGGSAGDLGGW